MNRSIAAVLAAVALVLAIVGTVMVFGSGLGPLPTTPGTGTGEEPRTEREHARVERRQNAPAAPENEIAFDDTPLPEPERLPGAPGDGFVKGTITDLVTGDVVRECQARLLHPTGEEISRSAVDHVGRYQFERVPDGIPLLIEITGPGYLTGHCSDLHLQPAEITRKDISLLRAPVVEVSVRAMPWQRAAANVPLRLTDDGRTLVEGVTDEFGRAELSVPEFGKFEMHAGGGPDGEWAPAPGVEVELSPGAGTPKLSVDVHRGSRLEVRVRDRSGGKGDGVTITVHGRGLEPVRGVSSELGVATLGPFPPDVPLQVLAASADGRRVASVAAKTRDGHDEEVVIDLGAAVRVGGVVRADGDRPVRRARVEIYLPDGGPLLGVVTTDERGRFTLAGVPDAPLEIRASAPSFVSPPPVRLDRPSARATVSLRALPSGTLRGVVQGADGQGVPAARVRLAPSELTAMTAKDGTFAIERVPAGESQRILVEAEGMRVVTSGGGDALLVTLAANAKKRVVILMDRLEADAPPATLEVAATIRVVSGTIVRGDGSSVFGAQVWWAGVDAVTGADGRFELERPHRPGVVARPFVLITPPAGLLEPLLLPLHAPDDDGRVEIAKVGLRDRHSCRISLASTPGTSGRSLAFALLLDGTDRSLGRTQQPFTGRTRVTYDGTWLHVAPIGDWMIGGHRRAFVGVMGPAGPLAARGEWPVAAGPTLGVTPEWRDAITRAVIRVPHEYVGGQMTFALAEAPDGVPIGRMGLAKHFDRRIRKRKEIHESFLRGTWKVTVTAPAGSEAPRLSGSIRNGKLHGLAPDR